MKQRFAAVMLIFMAFIGLGMLTASAQYSSNQASSTAAPGSSAAAGTYSQDYQQGMDQGLRMGFTMGMLQCEAYVGFNETAANEYNSRVDSFNQMITQVYGTNAPQNMYLQKIDFAQIKQYLDEQKAAAQTQQP